MPVIIESHPRRHHSALPILLRQIPEDSKTLEKWILQMSLIEVVDLKDGPILLLQKIYSLLLSQRIEAWKMTTETQLRLLKIFGETFFEDRTFNSELLIAIFQSSSIPGVTQVFIAEPTSQSEMYVPMILNNEGIPSVLPKHPYSRDFMTILARNLLQINSVDFSFDEAGIYDEIRIQSVQETINSDFARLYLAMMGSLAAIGSQTTINYIPDVEF